MSNDHLDICFKCKERKANHNWGDSLALHHGFIKRICNLCLYKAQVVYAWGRTCALPRLLWRLTIAWIRDIIRL